MTLHPVICCRAQSDVDREAAYKLRFRVYVGEMDKTLKAVDHKNELVRDELDDHASIFIVERFGEEIGTVRSVWARDVVPDQYRNWFDMDRFDAILGDAIAFSSRLMIGRQWRQAERFACC